MNADGTEGQAPQQKRRARLGRRSGIWRSPKAMVMAILSVVSLAMPVAAPAPASAGLLPSSKVILTGPGISSLTTLVNSVGGSVLANLTAVNGVLASVPNLLLPVLNAAPGVLVTPDLPVSVAGGVYAGSQPPNRQPAAVFPTSTGATQLEANGINGSGVAVAVLDTGIDNLPDFAGRLIDGVDFSGQGNPFQDSYGHGTFVAGLAAGNGASSGGQYQGEAPGADLVSIKVAGSSGQTDMASIILGIGWAISHRTSDHIGVLNLSLGMQPITSTVLNPLDMAAEAAWNSGITVVASAGNAGPFNGTILSPGDDPLVVTVGAVDDNGTATTSDDTMGDFSSAGPTNPDGFFKPDLVAPGRSVVSLRAPGSTIDQAHSSARVGAANFVGTGTSFSTAVTSGTAALVLQAGGSAVAGNPNTVKALLLGGATAGPVGNPMVDGHGQLNAYWSATASPVTLSQSPPLLATLPGVTVSLGATWSGSSWNGSSWNGSVWNGSSWNGSSWNGSSWNGSSWNGSSWNGSSWNGSSWNGSSWNGSSWNGSSWNGSSWNGSSWNGSSWNGSSWNGSSWNGSSWNGSSWN